MERGLDDRDQTCHTQDQESRPQPKGRATKQCVLGPGEHWGGGREGGRGQMNRRDSQKAQCLECWTSGSALTHTPRPDPHTTLTHKQSIQTQFSTAPPHTPDPVTHTARHVRVTHPCHPCRYLHTSLTVKDAGDRGSVHTKTQGGDGHGLFTPVIHHATLETQSWSQQILTPKPGGSREPGSDRQVSTLL